jgi:type I restriction enzyme S subunit
LWQALGLEDEDRRWEMKKGWISNKLGAITTKIGSGATPRGGGESYKETGTPLIRSMNVHDWGFKEAKLARIDNAQAAQLSNVIVEPDDVLLNITGASVARCCVVPSEFLPARVNQHVSIIRPRRDDISSAFLQYLLISQNYKDQLLHTGEAGSTRQAITKAQIQEFVIEYPTSLAEQQRIVGILDEAFAGLATAQANAEKNLQNARALFESHLQSVFTQRGKGWVETTLGEVCSITSVLVDPKKAKFQELTHVGAGNIQSQTGGFVDLKTAREEGLLSGKFPFDETMVLYSKIRPYLMKVARPDFAGLCSADMYPLSPKAGEIDRDFLFHLLLGKDFTDYAIQGSARAGMPKVNREHMFEYRFFLPGIKQKQIAGKLDALHEETQRLTSLYQQKLAALAALKKSLLHQAFSGEL